MVKFAAIIPARYNSSRFPGKPLALLAGKPVIQHVYETVASVITDTIVATDDRRIYDAVAGFGGRAVMTSDRHKSGTDRVAEAVAKTAIDSDVVINVQGDEPLVTPSQIRLLCDSFASPDTDIATLATPCSLTDETEGPNTIKVVTDNDGYALYFSRAVIPFCAPDTPYSEACRPTLLKHIGLYAFRRDTLCAVTRLPQSPLEQTERLEQLRWLQNGYRIKVMIAQADNIGIDTPEDLAKAEQMLSDGNIQG